MVKSDERLYLRLQLCNRGLTHVCVKVVGSIAAALHSTLTSFTAQRAVRKDELHTISFLVNATGFVQRACNAFDRRAQEFSLRKIWKGALQLRNERPDDFRAEALFSARSSSSQRSLAAQQKFKQDHGQVSVARLTTTRDSAAHRPGSAWLSRKLDNPLCTLDKAHFTAGNVVTEEFDAAGEVARFNVQLV